MVFCSNRERVRKQCRPGSLATTREQEQKYKEAPQLFILISIAQCLLSFDDPVRARQHAWRNGHADLLRGLKIDNQLELGWLLYG